MPAIYVISFLSPLTFSLFRLLLSLIFVYVVRFEVLEKILMKMQFFLTVTPCKIGKLLPAFRRGFGVIGVTDVSKEFL